MIMNSLTVIMLFVSFITGLLSLILFLDALSLYKKTVKISTVEERSFIEERFNLLVMIAVTVFIIKLLLWPFLYVTLNSYIPLVQGAMCIFGVTQVQPLMSILIQITKPFVFFFLVLWLIVNKIDEKTERSLLQKKGFLVLALASAISLIDSLFDLIYLTGFDIKTYVACCTTIFDLPERRFTATISSVFLGKKYQLYIMPAYYLTNILLLSFMVFILIYYQHTRRFPFFFVLGSGITSLINASVTVIATFESIAPKVMGLTDHHCIYCMWQYVPLSIGFSLFFIVGTFSPLWAAFIQFLKGNEAITEIINGYTKRLYLIGTEMIGMTIVAVTSVNFL